MLINTANLDLAFKGFQAKYNDGLSKAAIYWDKIAMKVNSASRDETYGWIGQMPAFREWVGPRVVKNLSAQKFTITNRKFESTIAIKREDFADDRLGTFAPVFANMASCRGNAPKNWSWVCCATASRPSAMTTRTSSTRSTSTNRTAR